MGYIINLKADTGLVDRSENTTRFYKDIKDYQTFTKEEEKEWFEKLDLIKKTMEKNSDLTLKESLEKEYLKVREYIALCNQRLVISAAKNYSTTETLTDYINEANFGLFEAIDAYDVTKGWKFATYAMWFILRAINRYKYGTNEMVKKPNYYKTFHVISKAKNQFIQKNEREPMPNELLEIVNNVYKKNIRDSNDLLDINYASINYESDDDNPSNFGEVTEFNKTSASYNDFENTENNEFNIEMVSSLLKILSPRSRKIIEMRFGLYDEDGFKRQYEVREIANHFNMSPERIRQIEKDSIKLMKEESKKRIAKYK